MKTPLTGQALRIAYNRAEELIKAKHTSKDIEKITGLGLFRIRKLRHAIEGVPEVNVNFELLDKLVLENKLKRVEIAKLCNCHKATVDRWRKRKGVFCIRTEQIMRDALKDDTFKNLSASELSKLLDISKTTVLKYRKLLDKEKAPS